MSRIITIGREYGSGGHEVGKQLAAKLGIPFYDKEIVHGAVEKSGFALEYMEEQEERKERFLPIISGTGRAPMMSAYQYINSDRIYFAQREVMLELAQQGACVMVGRCSDFVLKEYNPINLFIYGDLEQRIARKIQLMKENENQTISHGEMKKQIRDIDKHRGLYYEFYTTKKWGDKQNYHMCVNALQLGINETAELLSRMLQEESVK